MTPEMQADLDRPLTDTDHVRVIAAWVDNEHARDSLLSLADEIDDETERLRDAPRQMVYETTHLSPQDDDGSHWCRISKGALAQARAALGPQADREDG